MKVELYVTKTVLTSVNVQELEQIKVELCGEFGGLTEIDNCKGYWLNPKTNKLDQDNVSLWVIYSLTQKDTYEIIESYAKRIKAITNQECQLFAINDKPFFV
jgi:hypothetical protein